MTDKDAGEGSIADGRPGTGVRAGPLNDVDVACVEIQEVGLGQGLGPRAAGGRDQHGDRGRAHDEHRATNCAQCRGATGTGGIAADGTVSCPSTEWTGSRSSRPSGWGPFQMPAFEEGVLSDRDVDDIAAFIVDEMSSATPTPLFLSEINRVTMTVLAAVLVLAVVGGVLLIARPVRLPQEHREVQERAQEESGG